VNRDQSTNGVSLLGRLEWGDTVRTIRSGTHATNPPRQEVLGCRQTAGDADITQSASSMPAAVHLASAVAAVVFSQVTASSLALRSLVRPPSSCVSGHKSTMWPMVCRWPQSQSSDAARPHLCKLAWHGPWSVRKWFSIVHDWRGRSKPGCWIVGSHTTLCLKKNRTPVTFSNNCNNPGSISTNFGIKNRQLIGT